MLHIAILLVQNANSVTSINRTVSPMAQNELNTEISIAQSCFLTSDTSSAIPHLISKSRSPSSRLKPGMRGP